MYTVLHYTLDKIKIKQSGRSRIAVDLNVRVIIIFLLPACASDVRQDRQAKFVSRFRRFSRIYRRLNHFRPSDPTHTEY
jgi:hypothetical protein